MNFLKKERAVLESILPGLDAELASLTLLDMEQPGNPAIGMFRERGGTGLLIPTDMGGSGASPLQALRVQRAVASRAPSLAVATTMHHFSVAAIAEMVRLDVGSGMERTLLEGVAEQKLYLASGFAEGRTGAGILASGFRVTRTAAGWILNGSKKPCSLSASMDILTVGVVIPGDSDQAERFAVVTLPAATPGIERRPFWSSPVLAGAESDEVVLRDVLVPESLISYAGTAGKLDLVQERSFLWFELLIAASYLGIASNLMERVIAGGKGPSCERLAPAIELEGAMAALEAVARAMETGECGNEDLARALLVRYAVQGAIERAVSRALELLGGMAFIGSAEPAYLSAAARALAFHPPSRLGIADSLTAYLAGGELVVR